MRVGILFFVFVISASASAFESKDELIGAWRILELRCTNGGRLIQEPEIGKTRRIVFESSGVVRRSHRVTQACGVSFEGVYTLNRNRMTITGKSSSCRSSDGSIESSRSSSADEIEFAIREEQLHMIWHSPSSLSPECPEGSNVELIYVRDSAEMS